MTRKNGGYLSYYTEENFKTRKALKAALAAGQVVKVWSPGAVNFGLGGTKIELSKLGPVPIALEGPHYPAPHSWYAAATILNGAIVPGSVK